MYPGIYSQADPQRIAAVMAHSGEQLTYAELDERSRRLAVCCTTRACGRGDVVALLTDNNLRAFEVYWAAMRSGLYITAVNCHLTAGRGRPTSSTTAARGRWSSRPSRPSRGRDRR